MPYDPDSDLLSPGFYWVSAPIPEYLAASKMLRSWEPRLTKTRKTVENRDEGEVWAVVEVLDTIPREEFPFEHFDDLAPNLTTNQIAAISPYELGVWGKSSLPSGIVMAEELLNSAGNILIEGGTAVVGGVGEVLEEATESVGKSAGNLLKPVASPLTPLLIAAGVTLGAGGLIWLFFKMKAGKSNG